MNKIDTTQIVDPTSQQPFTGRSLQFLQEGLQDALNSLGRCLAGADYNNSTVYVLNGLEMTGANDDIANGYAFYNQELWLVEGATNTAAFIDGVVLIQSTPIDPAYDPVVFSDGVPKNVHNIRRLKIVDQNPGSGIADYNQVVFINRNKITAKTGTLQSTASASITNYSLTGGNYFSPSNRTVNLKVTFTASISFNLANSSNEGGNVWLRNFTGGTDLASCFKYFWSNSSSDVSTADSIGFTTVLTNVAPSTEIGLRFQRVGTNNVTLQGVNLIIEEIQS